MNEPTHRVAFPAAAVGVVVAFALTVLPILVGAAVLQTLHERGLVLRPLAIGVYLAIALTIALFAGGRFAAVSGRALSPRDGALHGLVAWSAWTVAVALAGLILAGAGWIDFTAIAARVATIESALWAGAAAHTIALGAAVMGGLSGARAE